MRARALVGAAVAVISIQSLAACGDASERDFCGQFADLTTAVEELQQEDPLNAKAGELRAASEEFQAELDQFQAVSEGRLDNAISTLRANVDALRQAAVEQGTEALEAARPQLEEAMEDVRQSWAAVQQLVETQCDVT